MRIKQLLFFCLLVYSAASQITNTRKWRVAERDSLDNALLLYEEANYKIALPIFENIHHAHPKEDFIKYLYGICCLYRSDKYEECLTALSEVYTNNTNIDQIEYDLARAYHYNYKFDEALELVNKHLAYKRIKADEKAKGELLKRYINNAKYYNSIPNKSKITSLNDVNSVDEEYIPSISIDEAIMIFNYTGVKSKGGKLNVYMQPDENGVYTSDIYLSRKIKGKFQEPAAIENINTNTNDVAVSLSQDGLALFSYKDVTDGHGDLYISRLTGDTYSQPAKLKGKVNSYSWEGHCALSPNGKTLYFSSERSGGFGGKDLYSAKLLADSVWGNVTNLGDSINTAYDEDAPFMHADGRTLFYSSKGLKSSGGYDIFKATMELKDSSFKKTENLGYPVNTPDDDIYFVLSADGTRGYYSSGKKGGTGLKDIYQVETGLETNKTSLLLLKGDVSRGGESVDAEIKVEIVSGSKSSYKDLRTNKGKYLVSLPPGALYKVTYSRAKFQSQTIHITTNAITGYVERIQNIDFDHAPDTTKAIVTPTVLVAKVTPTLTVSVKNTPTVAVTKVSTPTVAIIKNITPTVSVTNTVIVTKVTPTVTATATQATAKVNTITATPTVGVAKVTPTVTATKLNTIATTPTIVAAKVTPTVSSTPTVTTKATSTLAIIKAMEPQTVIVLSPTVPSTPKTVVRPANMTVENFVPQTPAQEKIKLFTEKYPDIGADSLDFRVQIAAFKFPKVYDFPHLKDCGKLENLLLADGVTRITIGGSFKTLRAAYQHNKKVVVAGQNDAFVTVIYKNRRISLEDLETMGIFKK
ncbi:MAG: PD40 domain-containing protein [Bacteroidetes bacterium]|nr:PD40 domain-containing protein [Bacteroidota bacterium]